MIKAFREGRQHGGVGEAIGRVRSYGVMWRLVTNAVILVATVVWIWYLPHTPWHIPLTALCAVLMVAGWPLVTIAVIFLVAVVWIRYLPGPPWDFLFTALFTVFSLAGLVSGVLIGLSELRRDRKHDLGYLGAMRAIGCLLMLSVVASSIYKTGNLFGWAKEMFEVVSRPH